MFFSARTAYTLTLPNDQTFYLTFAGANDDAQGDYSNPVPAPPKADPNSPNGAILINNDAMTTTSKSVVLNISATDTPLPGPATPASGRVGGPWTRGNDISGDVEMRISNEPTFADADWEPLAEEKPWVLGEGGPGDFLVFAQFRDAAGNESLIVHDDIEWQGLSVYLPVVLGNY
jgi:hypothetical protein